MVESLNGVRRRISLRTHGCLQLAEDIKTSFNSIQSKFSTYLSVEQQRENRLSKLGAEILGSLSIHIYHDGIEEILPSRYVRLLFCIFQLLRLKWLAAALLNHKIPSRHQCLIGLVCQTLQNF